MKNDQPKVSTNRLKKEALVAELSKKVAKAQAFVFANYQGMTHQQLETLKKALKKADAELVVAKNTLLKLALEKGTTGTTSTTGEEKTLDTRDTFDTRDTPALEGPTATLFAYGDVFAPLKALAKTIKALKLPLIKFGILDGKVISADQVHTLSTLPSKDVLIAQFVGGMKSPLYRLHRALNWNIQRFVVTLQAIADKKPAA